MSMRINSNYTNYNSYYHSKLSLRNENHNMVGETPDPVREEALQKQMQLEGLEGKSIKEQYEGEKCETCENRKYQDGSDDSGVSFQTPTHIDPGDSASAVRGHEYEHVFRERAAALRENRVVVSQSVQLHTDVCPECGKTYVSGGVTRTTTANKVEKRYQVGIDQEQTTVNAQA